MKFQEAKARMPKVNMHNDTREALQAIFTLLVTAFISVVLAITLGLIAATVFLMLVLGYFAFGPRKE
jgi:hypothetical protein